MAEPTTTAELPTLKILLIGSSGVGKSALVRRYTDDVFLEDDAAATIGVDFKMQSLCVDGKWCKLSIWDTAGQERYRTLTSSYYRGAQGVILVYDVTDARSFEELPLWLKELHTFQGAVPPLRLLVGNKVDCTAERVITPEQGAEFAAANECLFVECSAKAGSGVDDAFAELVRQVRTRDSHRLYLRLRYGTPSHPACDDLATAFRAAHRMRVPFRSTTHGTRLPVRALARPPSGPPAPAS